MLTQSTPTHSELKTQNSKLTNTYNGNQRENFSAGMLVHVIQPLCLRRPVVINSSTIGEGEIHVQCVPKKEEEYDRQSLIPKMKNKVIERINRNHKIQYHEDAITFNWFTYPAKITFTE